MHIRPTTITAIAQTVSGEANAARPNESVAADATVNHRPNSEALQGLSPPAFGDAKAPDRVGSVSGAPAPAPVRDTISAASKTPAPPGLTRIYAIQRLELEQAITEHFSEGAIDRALCFNLPDEEATRMEVACRPGTFRERVSDLVSYMAARGRLESFVHALSREVSDFDCPLSPGFVAYTESVSAPVGSKVAYSGDRKVEAFDRRNMQNGRALETIYDALYELNAAELQTLFHHDFGQLSGIAKHDKVMSLLPNFASPQAMLALAKLHPTFTPPECDLVAHYTRYDVYFEQPQTGQLARDAVERFAKALTRTAIETVLVFDLGWSAERLFDPKLSGRDQSEQLLAHLIQFRTLDRFIEAAVERYPGLASDLDEAREGLVHYPPPDSAVRR